MFAIRYKHVLHAPSHRLRPAHSFRLPHALPPSSPEHKGLKSLKEQLLAGNDQDQEELCHQRRNRLYNKFQDEVLLRIDDSLVFELTWIMEMFSKPVNTYSRINIRTNSLKILEEEPDLLPVVSQILKEKEII